MDAIIADRPMSQRSLQDKINSASSIPDMLRNAPVGFYQFPVPDEHTNWRDEQRAWVESAVLFDQSYHMTDVIVSGPDRIRFLAELAVNDFTRFEPMRAMQLVICADNGSIIGDAIAFHLPDSRIQVVGKPSAANYISYAAGKTDHAIDVETDIRVVEAGWDRKTYRFQIQGPNALDILEKVNGGPVPETRFFGMCEFQIDGHRVLGLRHGMAAAGGIEFWGPYGEREAVRSAILEAGESFDLKCGGGRVYSTAGPESGWVGAVLPAVYTGDGDMAEYRRWLPADSYEGSLSLGGSYISDDIEDYYLDPWDVGYHRLIHWDHDFKGREALLGKRDAGEHRRKVWLHWNVEDVEKVTGSMLRPGPSYKYLEMPAAHYSSCPRDQVLADGTPIGLSIYAAYTMAVGGWFSIGIINESAVEYGKEVSLVWGEPDGGTRKPTVEPHVQTEIRAIIRESARS